MLRVKKENKKLDKEKGSRKENRTFFIKDRKRDMPLQRQNKKGNEVKAQIE